MRFSLLFLLFSLFITAGLFAQDAFIQDVNILTMTDQGLLTNQDVLIRNGQIEAIEITGQLSVPDSILLISGSGRYLMPGLSEMHAHIPVPQDGDTSIVKETMMLYLANGVTVIRGMLGNPYHLTFRSMANSGRILAPRVFTSSPSMNGNSVPDLAAASRKVTEAKKAGYDFLKIHPGIKLEVMQSLVRTANQVGIDYAGHVPADVGITRALQYGFKTIDHVDGYIEGLVADDADVDMSEGGFFGSNFVDHLDWSKLDALVELTVDKNVWIVPTQSLFTRWISPIPANEMMAAKEMNYMPASVRYTWTTNKVKLLADPTYSADNIGKFVDARQKILRALHAAGVRFLLGSDSPQVMNVPGFSIHHEIQSLVEAGIPIDDVLMSGTADVARFFGEEGKYGSVVIGSDADLILLEENPLVTYQTLQRPLGTLKNGRWLDREFFAKVLAEIANHHAAETPD